MIKYVKEDASVTFAEIPIEICLCFNLSCCPHHCPGCHSPYLQTSIGDELTVDIINDLIKKHYGITCVLFMGGDSDKETLKSKNLKSAWYSGDTEVDLIMYGKFFDYIKVGPYVNNLGPLNSKTTNQRLYKIVDGKVEDITYTFWK